MLKTRKLLLILAMVVLSMAILPKNGLSAVSFGEVLLFGLIGFVSLVKMIDEFGRNMYSLNIMHWLFVFFFFFLAPVIQISLGYSPWGVKLSQSEIINCCLLILLWMLFYEVGNRFGNRLKIRIKKDSEAVTLRKESSTYIVIITLVAIVCAAVVISNVGFSNLFARKTSAVSYDGANAKAIGLLVSRCSRATIVYAVAMSIRLYQRTRKYIVCLLINVALLLVVCFPTGLTRNSVGTIYCGILLIVAYKKGMKSKIGKWFIYIFLLGFMIVFPAINAFRKIDISDINLLQIFNDTISDITSNYASGDYDAFSVVGDIMRYVSANGVTYGRQLLGVILFFVPRSIWNTKPYGSGQTVFEWMGATYTNISCPTVAEGYINFGIIGVVIFAFLWGAIAKTLDKKYWTSIFEFGYDYDYLTMLYPFLITLFFFMMRGDLMTTWAYTFAYIVVFWFMDKLNRFVIR